MTNDSLVMNQVITVFSFPPARIFSLKDRNKLFLATKQKYIKTSG